MNEHDSRLNEYIDGLLSPDEAQDFEAEMEHDPVLREEVHVFRALVDEAGRLPKGLVPERDLWEDIEAHLTPRTSRALPFGPALRVGLAAAAVALVFISGMWYARLQPGTPDHTALAPEPPNQDAPLAMAGFQSVDREYAEALQALMQSFDENKETLEPETVELIVKNLAIIRDAIQQIRTALDEDPGNPRLIRSLVAAYDQQVGLLQEANALTVRM